MTVAYVALGSNLGDRREHLRDAVRSLPGVRRVSSVYETAPVGGPEQGPYLNCVVEIDTDLDPHDLLAACQAVERAAERVRTVRWGPRTLDADVLLYDEIEVDTPDLVIPHPRMHRRRFVLAPLAELAPGRCPPGWEDDLPPEDVVSLGPL